VNIGEFANMRKEAFERLQKASPERPVTMPDLLREIDTTLARKAQPINGEGK
jgi:hypothetical protein